MSKILLVFVFILFVGFSFVFFNQLKPKQSINIQPSVVVSPSSGAFDYKASFAIFTHGTFRIFTAAMYHNQSSDVFIESSNPNEIRIKRVGITWNDFFQTLPFKLTKDCLTTGTGQIFCSGANGKLRFYLNVKEELNSLEKEIKNGDSLLVTYGNENEQQIQEQLDMLKRLEK